MRTDVVVKAFTEKAKSILLRNKAEEEELKRKYGTVVGVFRLKRLPSETQKHVSARLLTQHAFYDAKEDGFFCHRIIGRTVFNDRDKAVAYEKIKEEMLKDGLSLDEFGVRFYDEQ
jgi:ribosomal 30S subunit maturation factor RimM